ncbi:DNA polymerase III subunit delta [Leptolyngbya sp. AN03gr2]|uniref:DNA polymerase III subunit delta n=1 Tax=unclassified Leptolyngbya TaxID=2650499 RepID=UPI003D31FF15
MPLFLLIGQDQYQIQQQIMKLKARLNPDWLVFNAHTYSAEQLNDAIATARTVPIFDDRRLVFVENCQFQQFTERQFELLRNLVLPAQTILVFTGRSIDKRLKVAKLLLKMGKLQEFETIPPWRTDLIEDAIALQANQHNLRLSQPVIAYLATAIGNDRARIDAELAKLSVYANGKILTLTDAQQLIPNTTQNSLQLAGAIRTGNTNQVVSLLTQLFSRAESPLLILATLMTQFRTWLWVKSAVTSPVRLKDAELANCCNIHNPKRLYYLRQEVLAISTHALTQAVAELLILENRLKQGETTEIVLPAIMKMARFFHD